MLFRSLVYTAAPGFELASTFDLVYSAIAYDTIHNSVYLTLRYRPPVVPDGGGGGGGGGGGTTGGTATVTTDTGTLTVSETQTTLTVDTGSLTSVVAAAEPGATIQLTLSAGENRPTVTYQLPAEVVTLLREQIVEMAGQNNSAVTIDMSDIREALQEMGWLSAMESGDGTLEIRIEVAVDSVSARTIPGALAARGASDAFSYMVASVKEFARVSDTYRVGLYWIPKAGDRQRIDPSRFKNFLKFKLQYDPTKVVDVDRVGAVWEDRKSVV